MSKILSRSVILSKIELEIDQMLDILVILYAFGFL